MCVVARWHIQMIMRAMKSMKSMKMPAVHKTPAKRATKSMKAKKKAAVRMLLRRLKDDQIVDRRARLEALRLKAAPVYMDLNRQRAYVVAATDKIAKLEEEIKNNTAIVPETGLTLWEKAGDDMIAIVVKPRGPADVDSAMDPHQLEVEVTKYQILD